MNCFDTRKLRRRQRIKALKQRQNKPVMVSIRGEDGLHHVEFVMQDQLIYYHMMYGDKLKVFG